MQELLANTFEDVRTITTNSLQLPRRSVRLSTKPSISTQIEARESSKENDVSSEYVDKINNDVDYTLESSSEKEEEHKKPFAIQAKPVSNRILML